MCEKDRDSVGGGDNEDGERETIYRDAVCDRQTQRVCDRERGEKEDGGRKVK